MKSEQLHELLELFNPKGDIIVESPSGELFKVTGVSYLSPDDKKCTKVLIKTKKARIYLTKYKVKD